MSLMSVLTHLQWSVCCLPSTKWKQTISWAIEINQISVTQIRSYLYSSFSIFYAIKTCMSQVRLKGSPIQSECIILEKIKSHQPGKKHSVKYGEIFHEKNLVWIRNIPDKIRQTEAWLHPFEHDRVIWMVFWDMFLQHGVISVLVRPKIPLKTRLNAQLSFLIKDSPTLSIITWFLTARFCHFFTGATPAFVPGPELSKSSSERVSSNQRQITWV